MEPIHSPKDHLPSPFYTSYASGTSLLHFTAPELLTPSHKSRPSALNTWLSKPLRGPARASAGCGALEEDGRRFGSPGGVGAVSRG